MHIINSNVLLFYTYWFSLKLLVKEESKISYPALKKLTWLIIGILFIQLIYGALMAGHKAAPAAPTWPDINGAIFPAYVFNRPEGWMSAIDNPIVIHFIHRTLAYILLLLVLGWTVLSFRTKGSRLFSNVRVLPFLLITLQVVLGVLTVVSSLRIVPTQWGTFEWMAQLHQVVAFLFLLALALNLYLLTGKKKSNYIGAID
jgi:cytochrome c oxidase assembly protein subunit 15